MNWTMNKSSLETGMLIRRPGLDEALEVVNVRNGQAKIKLPGGKTSTIPASSEVEFAWPEKENEDSRTGNSKDIAPNQKNEQSADDAENPWPEESTGGKLWKAQRQAQLSDGEWQTDWSLLSVGAKIAVLGESGEFTVLRLTDSNARIKSDLTAQIQPMSIGHKFKVIESGKETSKEAKSVGKKSRAKKTALIAAEPEPKPENENEIEREEIADEPIAKEPELPFSNATTYEPKPLDDEEGPTSEMSEDDLELDADLDLDLDDSETDQASIQPFDDDDFEEENDMPKGTVNKSSARSEGQLLTLVEIAERTGISYPTLSRYVREHGDRLPSEGTGRKRRFYPSAIDKFREIRGESRSGRKPGDGSKRAAAKTSRKAKSTRGALASGKEFEGNKATVAPTTQRVPSASVSVAAWVPVGGQTIDSMLASAVEHAEAQILGLQSLVETLKLQREQLKLWS